MKDMGKLHYCLVINREQNENRMKNKSMDEPTAVHSEAASMDI